MSKGVSYVKMFVIYIERCIIRQKFCHMLIGTSVTYRKLCHTLTGTSFVERYAICRRMYHMMTGRSFVVMLDICRKVCHLLTGMSVVVLSRISYYLDMGAEKNPTRRRLPCCRAAILN
jgi:hypothetical protein